MKRRIINVLAILAIVLVAFTSCSTSIALNTLVPATVNVSGYKTVAVRSTIDDSGWSYPFFADSYFAIRSSISSRYVPYLLVGTAIDRNTAKNVAESTGTKVYNALNTGFYTLYNPTISDALVLVGKNTGTVKSTLEEKGIDAILTTSISNITYDEYVTVETDSFKSKDSSGAEFYRQRFYAVQKYSVSLTYTFTDVENNKVIAYDTISRSGDQKTLIGSTKNANGDFDGDIYFISSASSLINDLVSNICSSLRLVLAPHYETEYFDLMPNKPKIKALNDAYNYVKSGDYRIALEIFLNQYKTSGHVASGYNACILYYALGDYDSAFTLSSELYYSSGNTKVLELYYKLKEIKDRQDAALLQINSTEKSATSTSTELIGF